MLHRLVQVTGRQLLLVFRPCSHTACDACIGKATANAKFPNCDEMFDVFIGFNIGADSTCNGSD